MTEITIWKFCVVDIGEIELAEVGKMPLGYISREK